MTKDEAKKALEALLWELPAEFGYPLDEEFPTRSQFQVIKKSNVRKVHRALNELSEYFELEGKPWNDRVSQD